MSKTDFEQIVRKIHKYFQDEGKRCKPFFGWTKAKQRTMHALGISKSTLQRCLKSSPESNASVSVQEKQVHVHSKKEVLDSFDLDVIKRTIFSMHENKEYVTIKTLKMKLLQAHDLKLTKFVLWKALHKLKFKFGKLENNKLGMTERQDIVLQRVDFLKKIKVCYQISYISTNALLIILQTTSIT